MRAKTSILFLCLLAVFAGAAFAQTPDGETPAVETDCDLEVGAAFGLCNAYCEAMDCDCDGITCTPNANPAACTKVSANFTKKTNRTISCGVLCPCLDADAGWINGVDGTWAEIVTGTSGYSGDLTCNPAQTLGTTPDPVDPLNLQFVAVFEDTDTTSTCTWGDGTDGTNIANTLVITADKAAACQLVLAASCVP